MNQAVQANAAPAKLPKRGRHDSLLRSVLDEVEAAAYTGLSESSLRKGRMNGKRAGYVEPPPYLKLGRRVGYLRSDLDAWLLSHRIGGAV
jgi:predicted DNA-binding transcriptional regulator AlpA